MQRHDRQEVPMQDARGLRSLKLPHGVAIRGRGKTWRHTSITAELSLWSRGHLCDHTHTVVTSVTRPHPLSSIANHKKCGLLFIAIISFLAQPHRQCFICVLHSALLHYQYSKLTVMKRYATLHAAMQIQDSTLRFIIPSYGHFS